MHVSQGPDQWVFDGWRWLEVEGRALCLRPDTDLKKGMGDGAKLLSEAVASFEAHQGSFNPS